MEDLIYINQILPAANNDPLHLAAILLSHTRKSHGSGRQNSGELHRRPLDPSSRIEAVALALASARRRDDAGSRSLLGREVRSQEVDQLGVPGPAPAGLAGEAPGGSGDEAPDDVRGDRGVARGAERRRPPPRAPRHPRHRPPPRRRRLAPPLRLRDPPEAQEGIGQRFSQPLLASVRVQCRFLR